MTLNGVYLSQTVDALDLAGYKPSVENFGDWSESDFQVLEIEEDEINEADKAKSGRKSRSKATSDREPHKNGRKKGRKLCMWHREYSFHQESNSLVL